MMLVSLDTLFATNKPCIVSIVGAGGKTSLLFALGNALVAQGKNVLATTTTRMFRPTPADLHNGLRFAAQEPSREQDQRKVYGYPPGKVDEMFSRGEAEWILVEADGSAGHPIKAPAAHEPVIPASTGIVIAVVGLSCIGKKLNKDIAFRLEEITAVTGLLPGDTITPAAIASLVCHPDGMFKNAPAMAKRFLFANQADLPGAVEAGAELASCCRCRLDGIFVGSLEQNGLECQTYPRMQ